MTNSFQILDVPRWSSQDTILKKVMEKISKNPGQMQQYRQAQMDLFDPKKRIVSEFLYFCESMDPVSPATETRPPQALENITLLDQWRASRK